MPMIQVIENKVQYSKQKVKQATTEKIMIFPAIKNKIIKGGLQRKQLL
jgi:hypothetical protein